MMIARTTVPDYWPLMEAYHRVREPLYRRILAEAWSGLRPGALVLDAGCGDAFYSQLMAEVLGPEARIVAVDHNSALLKTHLDHSHAKRFDRCLSDIEQAGLCSGVFDAIWLCRTMHSAPDPLRRLESLRRLLQPGGRIVVVENDYAHYPILALPAAFERRLVEARRQYLQSECPNGVSMERYHAARHLAVWLEQAGFHELCIHTYVSDDIAPMPEEVETYWRLVLAWQMRRIEPFLSAEDRQLYRRAFEPESPDYLLRRPGFYCLELTTVGCGTRLA